MFGHGERKEIHLWLDNLPPLRSTHLVEGRERPAHQPAPRAERWKSRNRTYSGLAHAIADQWGGYVIAQLTGPTPPRPLPTLEA
ncbi:hypothetical protein FQZ97_1177310 [compost metagenome]